MLVRRPGDLAALEERHLTKSMVLRPLIYLDRLPQNKWLPREIRGLKTIGLVLRSATFCGEGGRDLCLWLQLYPEYTHLSLCRGAVVFACGVFTASSQ